MKKICKACLIKNINLSVFFLLFFKVPVGIYQKYKAGDFKGMSKVHKISDGSGSKCLIRVGSFFLLLGSGQVRLGHFFVA